MTDKKDLEARLFVYKERLKYILEFQREIQTDDKHSPFCNYSDEFIQAVNVLHEELVEDIKDILFDLQKIEMGIDL